MAKAVRALDIRTCIQCFTCLGKPCGAAGRGCFVHCGVCFNNCRGCCGGCGSCLVSCCQGGMRGCMCLFGSMLKAVLVLAFVGLAAFVIWVNWDAISETTGGLYNVTSNATLEYYDKVQNDPNVVEFFNKTSGYYDTAKDQINEGIDKVGSNPDVIRLGNQTAEIYGNAKNAIVDTFDSIKNHETVGQVINGTASVWENIKGWKIWG